MQTEADLLILGGGCAGLSLALRLAENPGRCGRVVVLESRPSYSNDRSWCFWRLGPHRYDTLVKRTWSQVAVRSSQRAVQIACPGTPYQMLEAGSFYDYARQRIANSRGVNLHLGVAVSKAPTQAPGGWRVDTDQGQMLAAQVIDTRPAFAPRAGGSALWQSFLGQELLCDRPTFDPACVELMDFGSEAEPVVAFTYVLPLAADHALVETTLFDPQPYAPEDLSARQQRAVQRLCGGAGFEVVRTESGILPMGLRSSVPALGPGHTAVGLMSGAARPATGYAFQRIQRWADSAADTLRGGGAVRGHAPDPLLTRLMDRLFLDVLRNHPQRGAELFTRLFERTATPRVLRFLGDRATIIDRLAVASSLPTGLFLRQLAGPGTRWATQPQLP